jgi:thymidylate synthase
LLRTNPDSRRIIVSAWNVAELDQMALMPCHAFFQFYVAPATATAGEQGKTELPALPAQRRHFLGVPFNIASYALLTHMVAQQCDLQVGDFIWTGGDCHIYNNHCRAGTDLQLWRARPYPYPHAAHQAPARPRFLTTPTKISRYSTTCSHPAIKAPVAV